MSTYIDLKFVSDISSRLEQFKKKGDYLFNFRCPHCGDSQKSKTKARAYFYRQKNDMFFKCHNCGEGQSLQNFLKFMDPKMYENYLLERYKGSAPSTQKPSFDFKPVKFEVNVLSGLKSVSTLIGDHPVRQYVENRKIPTSFYDKLYLCDKFMQYVNKIKPNTFTHTKGEHPRLIIPFYDETGVIFALQGRAFGKEQPKYLTIKLDEDKPKIYGLERLNLQQHIHIVEGPIDSMFVDNSIACAGADLKFDRVPASQVTYIFDNEPRNKEIVSRMEKVIDEGYNIMIWPQEIQSKDVNDLILTGKTKAEVSAIISNNTFAGLEAVTKLNYYKKC